MMKMQKPSKDQEFLSAYLDGQLPDRQRKKLEIRLEKEPELKKALAEINRTRMVLRAIPTLRASRNFTLTPEMVGLPREAKTRYYYRLRMVSAVASFMLILVLVGDLTGLSRFIKFPEASPQMLAVEDAPQAEFPISEAPSMEILKETAPGFGESAQEEMAVEDSVLVERKEMEAEGVPQEPEPYDSGDTVTGAPESELSTKQAEATGEAMNLADEIGGVDRETAVEAEEAPLMLEAPRPESRAPDEWVEGEIPPSTLTVEEDWVGSEPDLTQAMEGDSLLSVEGLNEDPEGEVDVLRSIRNWSVLRIVEFLLGLIAIATGLLAMYFRRLSAS